MKRFLITGGAGFVGSHCALAIQRNFDGSRVVVLDNLRRRGSEFNVPALIAAGVEFVHGDVRLPEDLKEAGPFDCLIECSAEPSVSAGYGSSPSYVVGANLIGLLNCLEAARRHAAGIVFLSTSRVYPIRELSALKMRESDTRFELLDQEVTGASRAGVSEAFPLDGIRSIYGATKLAGELMLQEYLDAYNLPGVINRCGVIAGPGQMGKVDQGFVVLWVARHMFNRPLSYIGFGGTGKQVRDILHIDDLVTLVERQLRSLSAFKGDVFNVGGGLASSVSLAELTALCRHETGRTIPVGSATATAATDIPIFLSDCTKIGQVTGWKPSKAPVQIVSDIARWVGENRSRLEAVLS